jgi:prepilin-type N-terminal cleavage/methylation domain-containing protein
MKGQTNMVGKVWRAGKQSKAFTIVELLIVIVVIAILAAIIIVGYNAVIGNANDKSVQADISKLADSIKLISLDNNGIPSGGATSSNTGDSTVLNGVSFKPVSGIYDQTVANLYYCSGTINGSTEFTIVARSKSGNAFSYSSTRGVTNFSGYTWTSSNNGVAVCTQAGYTAPFTWSYGYNPAPNYGWYAWAFNGPIVTNLVTNPSMESNITGWANYSGFGVPTRVTTTPWTGSARLSAVGLGTVTTPRVYTDILADPGDVISVSFRVRSDGQAATGGFLVAKSINGTTEISTFYSNTVSWTPDGNGWVNTTGTFTVPTGGTGIRLNVGLTTASNYSGTMGIDGVIAIKSTNIPTYADGNTPRWTWTGTANNSPSTGPAL